MMNHNNNNHEIPHIYRPKWYVFLWDTIYWGITWFIFGNVLFFILNILFEAHLENKTLVDYPVALFSILAIIIFSIIGILWGLLALILPFFSYIKITPSGIEQRFGFRKRIYWNWLDVDKLEKQIFTVVLYPKLKEVNNYPIMLNRLFNSIVENRKPIYISPFQGWPNGQLAADLKKYIPEVIDKK